MTSFLTGMVLLSWVALAVTALATAGLLRQVRYMRVELSDLRAAIGGSQLDATEQESRRIPSGLPQHLLPAQDRASVLLFVSPTCPSCAEAVSRLDLEKVRARVDLHLLQAEPDLSPKFAGTGLCYHTDQGEVLDAYSVPYTPFGIVQVSDRIVAAAALGSTKSIEEFLKTVEEFGPALEREEAS